MDFPVWHLPFLPDGLLMAFVAVIHSTVAMFTGGTGALLVTLEILARRSRDQALLDFVALQARVLLVVSFWLGATTGVGIWWAIGIVAPAATWILLKVLLPAWEMEWTAFALWYVTLIPYVLGFRRLSPRLHLILGAASTLGSWASLFWIDHILTFMATSGTWAQNRTFWTAFWNPTALPSDLLRTSVSLALAGLVALVTVSRIRDAGLRQRLYPLLGRWLMLPPFGILAGMFWYVAALPPVDRNQILGGDGVTTTMMAATVFFSLMIFSFAVWGGLSRRVPLSLAILLLTMGFAVTGATEWTREAIRKPYVISPILYANGIRQQDLERISRQGILATASWARVRRITPENRLEAGREIYLLECRTCHTLSGYNGVLPLIHTWSPAFLRHQLDHMHMLKHVMPPFAGTPQEKEVLVEWLMAMRQKGIPTAVRIRSSAIPPLSGQPAVRTGQGGPIGAGTRWSFGTGKGGTGYTTDDRKGETMDGQPESDRMAGLAAARLGRPVGVDGAAGGAAASPSAQSQAGTAVRHEPDPSAQTGSGHHRPPG